MSNAIEHTVENTAVSFTQPGKLDKNESNTIWVSL